MGVKEFMSLPKDIIYGILFSLAYIIGFTGYMFLSDKWNIGYCMEVRTLGETRGLYVADR